MTVNFILAFEKKEKGQECLADILRILTGAEAKNIESVVSNVIHFSIEVREKSDELFWILDLMVPELEKVAYIKIYNYGMVKGNGKERISNMTNNEYSLFRGNSFDLAKTSALNGTKSFREDYFQMNKTA